MREIRLHGRGGQGSVLAAELLVTAAFHDGKYGQAFPLFGGERRGAPVQAFVRLDDRPILVRHRVNEPDHVIILDRILPDAVDVLAGLKPGGIALIDSETDPRVLRWSAAAEVYTIPATRIALGVFGQPLVSAPMLGGWAAATHEISLSAIQAAFRHRFPGALGDKNALAAERGYAHVVTCGPTPRVAASRARAAAAAWQPDPELGGPGRPLHFALVAAPRTSLAYPTGGWRYFRPQIDAAACNGCGICAGFCPDSCLTIQSKMAVVDTVYCKGCGICAAECARHAIRMVEEA